jgi:hypothetical protein
MLCHRIQQHFFDVFGGKPGSAFDDSIDQFQEFLLLYFLFLVRSDSRDLEIKLSDELARNATAAALTRLDEFALAMNLCVHLGIVGGGGSVCGGGRHALAHEEGRNTQVK